MLTPDVLFETGPAGTAALEPHGAFLFRCSAARESGDELESRLALGAYLFLRLVDRLTATPADADAETLEGLDWQLRSAGRYIEELPVVECIEGSHLHGLMRSAMEYRSAGPRSLRVGLIAYAWHLESVGRVEEALDALRATAPMFPPGGQSSDLGQAAMTAGRLYRTQARWDKAEQGYALGLAEATRRDDRQGILLGRLGLAKVLFGRGNLPDARRQIEEIIAEADAEHLSDVRGFAYSDLAMVLEKQDLPWESLTANYRAFDALKESFDKARMLTNLGGALRGVGALAEARTAFECVLRTSNSWVLVVNAHLELIGLNAEQGDQVGFRRSWRAAEAVADRMSPVQSVEYRYRVGLGLLRFGDLDAGRRWLIQARQSAEGWGLNEWYFRVHRALTDNESATPAFGHTHQAAGGSDSSGAQIAEIAEGLREFAEALAV